jgi:hypothetical protein
MRKKGIYLCIVILIASLAIAPALGAVAKKPVKPTAPKIDPKATEMLRQMSDYLSGLNQFTVRAETTTEVMIPSGQALIADRQINLTLQRPNYLRADSTVPDHDRQIYYDGQAVTIYSPKLNYYAVIPAPATIEETVALARQRGIHLPLADLVISKPYDQLVKNLQSGIYVGKSLVQGVMCNQLAYRRGDFDWQIWIEDSETPLPKRVVIIDKAVWGAPRFMATFSDWDTNPTIDPSAFVFTPPEGAQKVPFIPDKPAQAATPGRGTIKKGK